MVEIRARLAMDLPASRITAVLDPTNTGKTHYAIERMLAATAPA
jgi:hypothetical protein